MDNEQPYNPEDIAPQEAHDALDAKALDRIGRAYDAKDNNIDRVKVLSIQVGFLEGMLADEETKAKIQADLIACIDATDRATFIQRALDAIQPILAYQRAHPKESQIAARRAFVEHGGFTPINELLSYGHREDGETIHIHLAPADGIENWRERVLDGFHELAHQVQAHPDEWQNFKRLTATSWIVAKNPGLLTRLGFTIEGPISDEARRKHFAGETRPIARAIMDRQTLLDKYL